MGNRRNRKRSRERRPELIRKSVRYKLAAGPITVQISGSPTETVKVAIREAN